VSEVGVRSIKLLQLHATRTGDREFGMEFDCELKVVLGYSEPLKEEGLKAQIDKWMDQPALSYSNLLLGLVLEWMEVFPLVLPP